MRMLLPRPVPLDDDALRHAYEQGPGIRIGLVTSVDGASALGGSSSGLGGPADLRVLLTLREQADAIVVGAGTVRAEGYAELGLDGAARARRVAAGLPAEPRLVVVSGRGEVPDSARGLDPVLVRSAQDVAGLRSRFPRLVCEGGPSLAGSLAEAGVVDELCVTLSPTLAGGEASRIVAKAAELGRRMRLAHVLEDDGFLFVRYTIDRQTVLAG